MLSAARQIYPRWKLGTLKNRFNLISASLKVRPELRAILDRPEHRGLRDELSQHPETLGFAEWPYIHAGWSAMQRFEALSQHKQALQSDMKVLDIGRDDSIVVADLSALSPGLDFVVDRAVWCSREGSLVFNLFVGDQRLMMIGCSFGVRGTGSASPMSAACRARTSSRRSTCTAISRRTSSACARATSSSRPSSTSCSTWA